MELSIFCDSGLVGCVGSRWCVSDYRIKLGDSLNSGKVLKSMVFRSSTECEYRSMRINVCEVVWLKGFLIELGVHYKPLMFDWKNKAKYF